MAISPALEQARIASLCLTTFLYGVPRKVECSLSLADTVTSIGRHFLRTFYDYDSSGVSQRLREHSSAAYEGPPGVIRYASAGNLGTGILPLHQHSPCQWCCFPSILLSPGSAQTTDSPIGRSNLSTKTSRVQAILLNWPACVPCP
jgi:hypothetical protein